MYKSAKNLSKTHIISWKLDPIQNCASERSALLEGDRFPRPWWTKLLFKTLGTNAHEWKPHPETRRSQGPGVFERSALVEVAYISGIAVPNDGPKLLKLQKCSPRYIRLHSAPVDPMLGLAAALIITIFASRWRVWKSWYNDRNMPLETFFRQDFD